MTRRKRNHKKIEIEYEMDFLERKKKRGLLVPSCKVATLGRYVQVVDVCFVEEHRAC